jgi:hypothetical protein
VQLLKFLWLRYGCILTLCLAIEMTTVATVECFTQQICAIKKATRKSPFSGFNNKRLLARFSFDRLQGAQLGSSFCQLGGGALEINLIGLL